MGSIATVAEDIEIVVLDRDRSLPCTGVELFRKLMRMTKARRADAMRFCCVSDVARMEPWSGDWLDSGHQPTPHDFRTETYTSVDEEVVDGSYRVLLQRYGPTQFLILRTDVTDRAPVLEGPDVGSPRPG